MASSLRRKRGAAASSYREGYLHSPAWQKFRREYFEAIAAQGKVPVCQVCLRRGSEENPLDLHHMSYDRVHQRPDGRWVSAERPEDVILICRRHHQRLHDILDFSRSYRGWSRRRASIRIITNMKDEQRRNQRS